MYFHLTKIPSRWRVLVGVGLKAESGRMTSHDSRGRKLITNMAGYVPTQNQDPDTTLEPRDVPPGGFVP